MNRSPLPARPAGRSAPARRLALFWALLAALLWQSFLLQTHQHLAFGSAQKPVAAARATAPGDTAPYDSPANCPICREAATAGPALLPAAVALAIPAAVAFFPSLVRLPRLALSERSHVWRSRAPPSLQA